MPSSRGERTLAVEWVAMVVLITGDALGASSESGGFVLPMPSRYFASMVVFLFLAGLAAVGERAAKLAGALGGVALLAMALAPPNAGQPPGPGNQPLAIRFLAWLSAMMKSGPATVSTGRPSIISQLPGGAAEANIALEQAVKDMNAACGANPNSAACKAAKQRVANIQSVVQGASS